jgi:hypothetical protein
MSLAKDAVDFAKGAKPGDLIFPNTIGSVEGHFLRKLQTIAERAGVMEPELHRFRKSYADTLADEGFARAYDYEKTRALLVGCDPGVPARAGG